MIDREHAVDDPSTAMSRSGSAPTKLPGHARVNPLSGAPHAQRALTDA
jgi:hypothetical protein